MKKTILSIFLFILLGIQSCKSVDDWSETPVFSSNVILLSSEYIKKYNVYENKQQLSLETELNDNPSATDLENKLSIEKEVALASNYLLQSWFNLYIELQLDPQYLEAYKGHYYFRKAINSFEYIEKIRTQIDLENLSFLDQKQLDKLIYLENQSRLFIAQQISNLYSDIDIESNYKEIKKLYRLVK